MTNQPRKRKYSSPNQIQGIVVFICNYILSYFKPDQEYTIEVYTDHWQIDEPQEAKFQIVDHVHTYTHVHIPDALVENLVKHEPQTLSPAPTKFPDGYKPLALLPIPVKIPDRYKPLVFPPILHDPLANFINNLPKFNGESVKITAEKHMQNIENFLDLFEVGEDDMCIKMFTLSLQGKVKNWFDDLPAASISNFQQFA